MEQATYDSVTFRFITADSHPDHDTIARFRKRFLKELEELFVQVLVVARAIGLFKIGNMSLDGTKVKAKQEIERRTRLRFDTEQAEYEEKLKRRRKQEEKTGKKA